jgi:hypothetical protein
MRMTTRHENVTLEVIDRLYEFPANNHAGKIIINETGDSRFEVMIHSKNGHEYSCVKTNRLMHNEKESLNARLRGYPNDSKVLGMYSSSREELRLYNRWSHNDSFVSVEVENTLNTIDSLLEEYRTQ